MPDHALTFKDGFQIRGLIGFPVIEAMCEIHFRRDGSLEISARASVRGVLNLAMEELRPLVQVNCYRKNLACLLGTGSGQTAFHQYATPATRRAAPVMTYCAMVRVNGVSPYVSAMRMR